MGSEWHAPYELLKPETQDMTRALNSLQEELEAMDWYNQRIDVTHDEELRGILAHNRDEEKEHAAMVLEWIRRHDPVWDGHLRTYLFTDGDILVEEAQKEGRSQEGNPDPPASGRRGGPAAKPSLTVGSLRANKQD
jgi:ferritin-like protein